MKGSGISSRQAIFVLLLGLGFGLVSLPTMAQNYVPATSSTCDLGDISDQHDTTRFNPEWAPINTDANHPLPNNVPNILEGFVAPVPSTENQNSQAPAEVSEEEIPWNHYTHDYTFKVVPDSVYQHLLASWNRLPQDITVQFDLADSTSCSLLGATYIGNNTCQWATHDTCPDPQDPNAATCHHEDMEVEWENGSVMHVNGDSANNTRKWGSLPEYAWPSIGDRVWLEGRWIFDCGHAGVSDGLVAADGFGLLPSGTHANDYVKFESEIHPPRALATFRLGHTALSQETTNSSGDPFRAQSDEPSSWLPVTGTAIPQQAGTPPWTPPTLIPVTEADIFVSGNGGGANDLCNIVNRSDSSGDCSPYSHTGPVIPINNYNYVFDIYPPGTNYSSPDPNGVANSDGVKPFQVTPPVPDASLQWRTLDQSSHIPEHTCGPDKSSCVQAEPILCLVGPSTPPPPSTPADQTALSTTCPALLPGERPTRLRVILPFYTDTLPPPQGNNQTDTYFAQTIVLGWDDVPDGQQRPAMRRWGVTLEEFKDNQNGRCTICGNGDWRVFVDVGGQWRWISWLYDTDNGIYAFDGGSNSGHGDPLTNNGDDDFYHFTKTPWISDVVDGRTLHVAVGGFDSGPSDGGYCDSYSGSGCDYSVWNVIGLGIADVIALARIGTYEFDLYPGDCANECTVEIPETETERQYTTTFKTFEIDPATPPTATLSIGDPHYNNFVSSATPFDLKSTDAGAQGFQYRFHQQGGPLPVYSTTPFPIYWTSANLPANSQSVSVYLNGASAVGDGAYDFQYAAQSVWNLLEPRHTTTTILDNTPPVATISSPTATQYTHADVLTLSYLVDDGTGSGVKSSTPKMDGSTTLPDGTQVTGNNQMIPLLILSLGSHTFSVDSVDNLDNAGTNSVTFTIVVTPDSLKKEVNEFLGLGCIDNAGLANSLVSKMAAVQTAVNNGQIQTAINILSAFITEVQAQAGKHISTTCSSGGHTYHPVQTLLGDAQYLLGVLGAQLHADPILGNVVNSGLGGISGATVRLLNSTKATLATAVTDVTGFYYFAATGGLTPGKTYSVKVTLPTGYKSSTPSAQSFTWSANSVTLANFGLR